MLLKCAKTGYQCRLCILLWHRKLSESRCCGRRHKSYSKTETANELFIIIHKSSIFI